MYVFEWLRSRLPKRPVLKARSKRSNHKRLRRLTLNLTARSQLVISLRYFRTQPARRAKHIRQIVFWLPAESKRSIKEVAIALVRRKKHRPTRRLTPSWFKAVSLPSRQTALPLLLIGAGLAGTVYFSLGLHKAPDLKPAKVAAAAVTPSPPASPKTLPRSEPISIRIPKIEIDTSIVTVGRADDGSLEPPSTFDQVGWYRDSPTPGQLGPAIMVGHVDQPNDIAIFWRLHELLPGDVVKIGRADGQTARFAVERVEQFSQADFPTQAVYGNINYAGLRLITCGGVFNPDTGHYNENTVVYARLL